MIFFVDKIIKHEILLVNHYSDYFVKLIDISSSSEGRLLIDSFRINRVKIDTFEDFKNLFFTYLKILEIVSNSLLDERSIILSGDFIFQDGKMKFVYLPSYKSNTSPVDFFKGLLLSTGFDSTKILEVKTIKDLEKLISGDYHRPLASLVYLNDTVSQKNIYHDYFKINQTEFLRKEGLWKIKTNDFECRVNGKSVSGTRDIYSGDSIVIDKDNFIFIDCLM